MCASFEPRGGRLYQTAVEISNGFKHYGMFNNSQIVLQKFNLTAYPGELYVILGPHGCGKSTVLNIILGLTRLNHGVIEVFGYKPGSDGSGIPGKKVGYTPQIYGLYENFTVTEILKYYGVLLGLSRGYLDERMAFLDILLSLPARNTYIQNCAETVKRQVSFAIALLHEPELLVLDEPTAGVDPVLARSIWSHLQRLAGNNKTIVVSTTNATETQNAQRMGIMRSGYLLLEGRPKHLLEKFKENTLEALYYKTYTLNFLYTLKADIEISDTSLGSAFPDVLVGEHCYVDVQPFRTSASLIAINNESLGAGKPKIDIFAASLLNYLCPHPRRIVAMVLVGYLRIIRSYSLTLTFFVLPMLLCFVYGLFIGGQSSGLQIIVINNEADEATCQKNVYAYASCLFLHYLSQRGVRFVRSDGREVFWRKNIGKLVIGSKISEIFYSTNKLSSSPSDYTECGIKNEDSCLVFTLDETSRVLANEMAYFLYDARRKFDIHVRNTTAKRTSVKLIDFVRPYYGNSHTSEQMTLMPGLFVMWTFYSAMLIGPLLLLMEYDSYTMTRRYVAGVKLIEVVIAQLLTYTLLVILQSYVLVIVMAYQQDYLYKVNCYESIIILVPLAVCGYFLGLLGVFLLKDILRFMMFAGACLFLTITISGLCWTYYAAPEWFKPVMQYTPHFYPAKEMRWSLMKNIKLADNGFLSCWILMSWTGVFVLLCLIVKIVDRG